MGRKLIKAAIIIVTIVSLLILVAVFIVPSSFYDKLSMREISGTTAPVIDTEITINIEEDTVTYNGIGSLELMTGVTATDQNGNDYTNDLTAAISDGENDYEKTITYSVKVDKSTPVTATRKLKLQNYKLPSIECSKKMVTVDLNNVNNLVSQMITDNTIVAYDGFGHNISNGITADLSGITKSGDYNIVFLAENILNDEAQVTVTVRVQGESQGKSPITLKSSALTIQKNSQFNPMDYVIKAVDSNGADITSLVKAKSTVDTAKSGQYVVTYYLEGIDETTYTKATLTVTVN